MQLIIFNDLNELGFLLGKVFNFRVEDFDLSLVFYFQVIAVLLEQILLQNDGVLHHLNHILVSFLDNFLLTHLLYLAP